ncbi:MAG TPA: hypothetical protein VGV86_11835 [Acidimicrobiales bacterium]|nr:hypothetical protein [Acidimicrobiales bacterium]
MIDEPADPTPAAAAVPPHPGAPRWVKVMGILVLLLVGVLVVAKLTGGGDQDGGHGPGRHSLPAAVPAHETSQAVTAWW